MKNDSLSVSKRNRMIWLSVFSFVIISLVLYGVLMPGPEEKSYSKLKDIMLNEKPEKMSKEDQEELRKTFEQLSPESRDKLVKEVMRSHLEHARDEVKNLSIEEKRARIDKMVQKSRSDFEKMSDEDREKIKTEIGSAEGKKRMEKALDFYYEEFTPEERDLFDPLVQEVMSNLNSL